VLALVQASRLVCPDSAFQPAFSQLLLEQFLQFRLGLGIAASAWMPCRPLVSTNEDMLLKLGHMHTMYKIPRDPFTLDCRVRLFYLPPRLVVSGGT